ncbi:MAG: hypothetical protein OEM62_02870 [Acidobacteriota bacterium]|nr:hypothetical protein [Acidobacteriota bacterium]
MNGRRMICCFFSAALLLAVPTSGRAAEGDKVFRGAVGYVIPTTDFDWTESGQQEYRDPAFPPLGRLESLLGFHTDAEAGLGLRLGFEYLLTERIGIDAGFDYSSHDAETVFSGRSTFTPLHGDPPVWAPEASETAPIIGIAAGEDRLIMITVGVNFHFLDREKLDLYLGPVVGGSWLDTAHSSGGYTVGFDSFVLANPARDSQGTEASPVFGAVLGTDIATGRKGWMQSASIRYLAGSVAPLSLHVGLGYRR